MLKTYITYKSIILVSWATLMTVWFVLAFNVKQDIRSGHFSVWMQYLLRFTGAALIIVAVARIGNGVFTAIFAPPITLGWIGALLTALGIALAIWARLSLGRNWSARLSVKVNHQLVTTGPYAYVRHPLYTGVVLAAFGTMLTGMIFGIVEFIAACAIVASRIKKEERDMLELFPDQYPEYKKKTCGLIPFIW